MHTPVRSVNHVGNVYAVYNVNGVASMCALFTLLTCVRMCTLFTVLACVSMCSQWASRCTSVHIVHTCGHVYSCVHCSQWMHLYTNVHSAGMCVQCGHLVTVSRVRGMMVLQVKNDDLFPLMEDCIV